ncbi:hypothetical protein F5972_01510 [Microbispora cellulosiformans]|uniref:Uncharacterized protein n=1 Tax=Microbispora cellulosiformans TaxID=2614688 RepID=A0A5J5KA25_9ACTN|nr:hypothetical protein [Microbispora cellulosiformans]KAA9381542.1 hypothetical protein F5972_01510 [Microbispora cellulosiformans]
MTAAPRYLGEPHADALLSGLLLLTQEVAVLRHRCAVLEAERDGRRPPPPDDSDLMPRLVDELFARLTTDQGTTGKEDR